MDSETAARLQVADGDGVTIDSADILVAINDSVANGCVAFSAGFPQTAALQAGASVSISKTDNWKPRQLDLISSDRGGP